MRPKGDQDNSDDSKPLSAPNYWIGAIGVVVIVLVSWGINFRFSQRFPDAGTFGDAFGAVNSLFSGLALAGVIYAILMQRYEVKLLEYELSATKNLLDRQQKSLENQQLADEKKSFEETFFKLLEFHMNLVHRMDLRNNKQVVIKNGKDVISAIARELINNFSGIKGRYLPPADIASCVTAYEVTFKKHNKDLAHYYRSMYNIMKFIDSSSVNDRKFYSNIFRAQLSNDEVFLLSLNCLSGHGGAMVKYLSDYALLKHIFVEKNLNKLIRENLPAECFLGGIGDSDASLVSP